MTYVGVLYFVVDTSACHSLKEKRSVVRSIVGRAEQRYPISISEVDHQNDVTRAGVSAVVVHSQRATCERILGKVERAARSHGVRIYDSVTDVFRWTPDAAD
jgi:uncharacterized protein YlxP (DUF503 family)